MKSLISHTTVIPVVFVIGIIVFNLLFLGRFYQSEAILKGSASLSASLGGPSSDSFLAVQENDFILNIPVAYNDEDTVGFVALDSASVLNTNSPLSNILNNRDGLAIYKVKSGDTLSKIASSFGISVNTILWANQNLKSGLIVPGQEIVILPVSGVVHQVQESETPESIADSYGVNVSEILKFNKDLNAGTLIVPGARNKKNAESAVSGLPEFPGYFVMPTTGWNWGRLHPYNAVDIANACGTPIYAAAEGLVTIESSYGWNSGYGHYLDIEHPNGTATRYSHTSKNLVSAGDYVSQGDLIAYIGNTGNTHGPTGCHLHFEVRGAKNPFIK